MNIIVLDGKAMHGGDLAWDYLAALGELEVFDRTAPEQLLERMRGAQAAITNKVCFDEAAFKALPELEYIGVTATGVNIVDLEAASRYGVTVTNVPAYSTDSVAQMVFALLLELASRVGDYTRAVHADQWTTCEDFCFMDFPIHELAGRTLGVVGFGQIGQAVARIGAGFGMNVIVTTRRNLNEADITQVDLNTLLKTADVVSLNCPLTSETEKMINADRLNLMKPTAYLINTARGGLLDEPAVAEALNAGKLAGLGVDVLGAEPPHSENPLLNAPNCMITPHVAWATHEARTRLLHQVAANLQAYQQGQPVNVVSPIS